MARPAAPFVPDPAAARKRRLGERGETIAARHLTRCGMVLLDRNWRCDAGEIDLVLRDGHVLVICEVKTRTSIDYGAPLEAIDRRFFRQKYDAARTLASFAVAARDQVDLDALQAQLVDVVDEAMQPERVTLWLRPSLPRVTMRPAPYGKEQP